MQAHSGDIVVFGGNGDLALRKIMPALYYRIRDAHAPFSGNIIAAARTVLTREAYLALVRGACQEHIRAADWSEEGWEKLASKLDYLVIDAQEAAHYAALAHKLNGRDAIFYLSTPANLFGGICRNLRDMGLITPASRVVMEKPIGDDLASFRRINAEVLTCFDETQIYRIDHYLGKEAVQNLMVLRFANPMFERLWNAQAIDHVQITVAEELGVGTRGGYYDASGALRDMVQNHLLQLLCLVAMEPPVLMQHQHVRDEKLKVLRALRPVVGEALHTNSVRGQYEGYAQEVGNPTSHTETFVALKVHVDNWRWSGVPFYLRTGKAMHARYSEIVVQLRPVPHNIFPLAGGEVPPNKLVIRLQPDESFQLQMNTKIPGPGGYQMKPLNLNLNYADAFHERLPEAYERLLMDVLKCNPTLFMRSDEVEAAWAWSEQILQGWQAAGDAPVLYKVGSYPREADRLLAADERAWHA